MVQVQETDLEVEESGVGVEILLRETVKA